MSKTNLGKNHLPIYCVTGLILLLSLLLSFLPCLANTMPVSFKTTDGVIIKGDIHKATTPCGVVVLLHMLGHSRQDYEPLLSVLLNKNLSVLTVDFRGHGESVLKEDGSSINYQQFTQEDWAKLPQDVELVLSELPKYLWQPGQPLYIVGASIGANTAVLVAANNSAIKKVVLLSPGLDYHGLSCLAVKNFTGPVLIVASSEDEYSYTSSKKLAELNKNHITIQSYSQAGHGTQIFAKQPELAKLIADFLTTAK